MIATAPQRTNGGWRIRPWALLSLWLLGGGLGACAGPRNAPNALYLRRLQAKADAARAREQDLDRALWQAEQQIRDDRAAIAELEDEQREAAAARRRATLELAATLDSIAAIEAELVAARVRAAAADREFAALQERLDRLLAARGELAERAADLAELETWLAAARSRPQPADGSEQNPAEGAVPGEAGAQQAPPPEQGAGEPPGQGGGGQQGGG